MERKRVFDAHVPGILTYRWKNIMNYHRKQSSQVCSLSIREYPAFLRGGGGWRGRGEEKRVAESPQKSPLP